MEKQKIYRNIEIGRSSRGRGFEPSSGRILISIFKVILDTTNLFWPNLTWYNVTLLGIWFSYYCPNLSNEVFNH